MPKASEIKRNAAIDINGEAYIVRDIERSVPQGRAGGSLYRMRMYNVSTNHKIDETFKDSDMLTLADLTRRAVTFSYADGDEYVFMDSEDYTSYSMNKDAIEDELMFVTEDLQGLHVIVVNDAPVALDLPGVVELEIIETDPHGVIANRNNIHNPDMAAPGDDFLFGWVMALHFGRRAFDPKQFCA